MVARSKGLFALGLRPVGTSLIVGLAAGLGVGGTLVAANMAEKSPPADPLPGWPAIALRGWVSSHRCRLGWEAEVARKGSGNPGWITLLRYHTPMEHARVWIVMLMLFFNNNNLEPRCNSAELDPTTQHADASTMNDTRSQQQDRLDRQETERHTIAVVSGAGGNNSPMTHAVHAYVIQPRLNHKNASVDRSPADR